MAYIIREEKNTEDLFRVKYYDNELDEELLCPFKFETDAVAEQYGRETYDDEYSNRTSFIGIELEGGHPTDAGDNLLYIDANHPLELYYVPAELKNRFERWGAEDGLCLRVVHWKFVKNTYDIIKVSLDDEHDKWCPFSFARTPGEQEETVSTAYKYPPNKEGDTDGDEQIDNDIWWEVEKDELADAVDALYEQFDK